MNVGPSWREPRVRRCTSLTAVVGSLVFGLVSGAAAAAPAGWSEPEYVSDVFEVGALEGLALNYPDLAVSGTGDAVVAWTRQEQLSDLSYLKEVFTRDRVLGGDWGPVKLLGRSQYADDPRVGTNAGTTVVAWESANEVLVRVRRAGGDYAAAKTLGPGREVQVGVDDAGRAIVLWSGGGADYGIRAARYVPGSGWSSTTTISFSPTAQTPDLAVSGGGDAIATWKAEDGVRVTEFTPGAGWTAHRLVGPGGVRPSVATNDAGQVALAWTLQSPVNATAAVWATLGSIRGGLGRIRQLSDDVVWDWYMDEPTAEAAMGPGGDAALAWNRPASWFHDQNVQVITGLAAYDSWNYPRSIAVPTWNPRPSLGVFADGTVLAVWRGGYAAIRPADGQGATATGWTTPFNIASTGTDPYNADVALDDAGRVHVAWADLSRPPVRMDDHIAAMAVQATSFGAPGSAPAPIVPTPPAAPVTTGAGQVTPMPSGGSAGGGGSAVPLGKVTTARPSPVLAVVWRKGRPYISLRLNVPRPLIGRTLWLERRIGKRTVVLARFRATRAGALTRLVPLGASTIKGAKVAVLRVSVRPTATASGASSTFRSIPVAQRRR